MFIARGRERNVRKIARAMKIYVKEESEWNNVADKLCHNLVAVTELPVQRKTIYLYS